MSFPTTHEAAEPADVRPSPEPPAVHGEIAIQATHRRRRKSRGRLLLASGAVLILLAGSRALWSYHARQQAQAELATYTAHYERLQQSITDRGELESADNRDIYCRVKAGTKNSTIATTIKWVIDEGAPVKKGDLLIDLDDSGLQEQLKQQRTVLDKATADKVVAEENYKIVQAQGEGDIKTAEVTKALARIDLRKYREGEFPQTLEDVEGRIKVAESDVEMQRDRAAWSQRMVKKGYQTVNQAQVEQSLLDSLTIGLGKVQEERRVLTDPVYGLRRRTETDLGNKLSEAAQALRRVKGQASSLEKQARADRALKRYIYWQELRRYREIDAEIKKCRLFAPQAGMVVYCLPEQVRRGGGAQQAIIAQGEPVREGQKLMQIPDLRHMVVNANVPEALVSRVHPGQRATVRVTAVPGRVFPAHVEQMAGISSTVDWYSDLRVFETKVVFDEEVEGLRPGLVADVAIDTGDSMPPALTVPVRALVGSVGMGNRRHCYVLTADGMEERDVIVGPSTGEMAGITEGLHDGDEVVLDPRAVDAEAVVAHATLPASPLKTAAASPWIKTSKTSIVKPVAAAKKLRGGKVVSEGEQEIAERRKRASPPPSRPMDPGAVQPMPKPRNS
jgi:multidrug efflux pump subunit AcrA (membrane-fusion protein)